MRRALGSGRFWMWSWLAAGAFFAAWGAATFVWWMDSVRNLNAMTVVGLWIATAAGMQSTLGMRKVDPKDPL